MMIDLPDTDTGAIARGLTTALEGHALTTGRVLTLLVAIDDTLAGADARVNATLAALRESSFEHPARVLVLVSGDPNADTRLDAQLHIDSDNGASEVVVMTLQGELTSQLDSVVTPLLLPDTPVVVCWPQRAPRNPAQHPLGQIAQRRITNVRRDAGTNLEELAAGYYPGDSDIMWSRITPWRGTVASALDRYPGHEIHSVDITGAADNPSVDIAAGWLASSLRAEVTRRASEPVDGFPISQLVLHCDGGDIEVTVQTDYTVRIEVPGRAASLVAMGERSDADCLAEELRHLGPDATYGRALRGLSRVTKVEA